MDSELCDYCGEELEGSPVATICQRCYETMVDKIFAEDPDLYYYIVYGHELGDVHGHES